MPTQTQSKWFLCDRVFWCGYHRRSLIFSKHGSGLVCEFVFCSNSRAWGWLHLYLALGFLLRLLLPSLFSETSGIFSVASLCTSTFRQHTFRTVNLKLAIWDRPCGWRKRFCQEGVLWNTWRLLRMPALGSCETCNAAFKVFSFQRKASRSFQSSPCKQRKREGLSRCFPVFRCDVQNAVVNFVWAARFACRSRQTSVVVRCAVSTVLDHLASTQTCSVGWKWRTWKTTLPSWR